MDKLKFIRIVACCCSHCGCDFYVHSLFCGVVLIVLSSVAIILLRKKEQVAFIYSDLMSLWFLCSAFSRCCGLICSLCLWYYIEILTFLFGIYFNFYI